MEKIGSMRTRPFEDSSQLIENPERLRQRAARDGFLFLRELVPIEPVLSLRRVVLNYASQARWLDPDASMNEAHARPGKRIGCYQDPEWVDLQLRVQNGEEMWALGEAIAIHRVLNTLENRSSYLCLSTANTCRVFSPHPDMATQPHQDAYYVRAIGDFWTAWIPLGDCPLELGPLAVLAGSHHGGLRAHSGQGIVDGGVIVPDDAVWSSTDFQCGDVVLFKPFTLHCSLPNRSRNRLRLSVDFRYGFWTEATGVDWRHGDSALA